MSLRAQLAQIYEEKGKLTPQLVLDEARNKSHPLHDRFEWDNKVAGEAYRLHQAHRLIITVRQTFISGKDGLPKSLRSYQAVRDTEESGGGYKYEPTEKVAADPFLSALIMKDMEREWRTLRRRYEDFSEFWELVRTDSAAA